MFCKTICSKCTRASFHLFLLYFIILCRTWFKNLRYKNSGKGKQNLLKKKFKLKPKRLIVNLIDFYYLEFCRFLNDLNNIFYNHFFMLRFCYKKNKNIVGSFMINLLLHWSLLMKLKIEVFSSLLVYFCLLYFF